MRTLQIIIAEDDNWYSEFLEYHLTLLHRHQVIRVKTASDLFKQMKTKPDLITLDYNLPDMKGDEILKRVKLESPNTEVVLVSGQNDIDTAFKLMENGAFDYIVKNEDAKNRLHTVLHSLVKQKNMQSRIEELENHVDEKYDLSKYIVGNSKEIKEVFKYINKAINSSINVSISGATGTGKEVVAKAIHFNSRRSKEPFIAINLSAIPETLVESELFGYTKGSFTGADKNTPGKFELAKSGTIFLDEIGETSLATQVKILRVLQERTITRIGSNDPKKINCRIICATHQDLSTLVNKGLFREDLYYRLIGLPIHLPDLSDRGSDIVLLAKHFAGKYCGENHMPTKSFSPKSIEKLMAYKFPGNVRELKSIIDLACVMSESDTINEEDLMFNKVRNLDDLIDSDMSLKEINEKIILRLLDNHNNNILKVANKLKIGKSTIYRLLSEKKQLGLN